MTLSSSADLLQRGIEAARAKRHAEARELLLRVVELDDHNEQAWLWLSGVVEEAADRRVCLENVLAINPANRTAHNGLRWLDEHAPAAPVTAQEQCPHCRAPLPTSGSQCPACKQPILIVCPNCGNLTEIVKAQCVQCGHLFTDFRQRARFYVTLAGAYADRGRLTNAHWAIDQALVSAPDEADLWRGIARVRTQLDRPDDAIAAYHQAIALAPDQPGADLDLIDLCRHENRSAEAEAAREQLLRRFQADRARLIEIGQALIDRRDAPAEASRFFERAVEVDPRHVGARLLLGALYFDRRDFERAREHLQHAVELTDAKTAQGQQARQALARVQTVIAPTGDATRSEALRQLAGPLLISIMAALSNARFSPQNVSGFGWLGLVLSAVGAGLWAVADTAPRSADRRRRETATGLSVWLIGLGLIVAGV